MSISEDKVWVLIPAAGIGSRMQSKIPKQYLSVHGATILEHTLSCFLDLSDVAGVVVVISRSDDFWLKILQDSVILQNSRVPIQFTYGGLDRAGTVSNGLRFLIEEVGLGAEQWVMVHDAARPCVKEKDLLSLLDVRRSSQDCDGAILAYRVKDTMKRSSISSCLEIDVTEPRENLWHALTPQLFRLEELLSCLRESAQADYTVTDEASAMEYCGKTVNLVESDSDNIKLTSPSDLPLIEFLLANK